MYKPRNIFVYVVFKFADSSTQMSGKASVRKFDIIFISGTGSISNANWRRFAADNGVLDSYRQTELKIRKNLEKFTTISSGLKKLPFLNAKKYRAHLYLALDH